MKGEVKVNLVTSKYRLAPPDGDTIPCLELLGTLLGARLLYSLRLEYNDLLKIDDEFLWMDSGVALTWINQGPRVANRVEEMRLQLLVECGHGFQLMKTLLTYLLNV